MISVFAKPLENLMVRFPGSRDILPKEGCMIPFNTYWRRRHREGSIIIEQKNDQEIKNDTKFNRKEKTK